MVVRGGTDGGLDSICVLYRALGVALNFVPQSVFVVICCSGCFILLDAAARGISIL